MRIAVALLVIGFVLVSVAFGQDICWRDSYGRGVGTIPTTCRSGQVNDAGLCYDACGAGYENGGPLCLTPCPGGFTNTGLHCLKPEAYGRGAGYGFVPVFENLSVARTRCENSEGRGNCEQWGLMYYPKCRPGFSTFGSNICSPTCPSNMTDIGVSCQKGSYGRGAGTIPSTCGAGEEYDAGLCYQNCDAATVGIGPVCWSGSCPADFPVNCGASCAVSEGACVNSILKQVLSTSEVAVNVGLLVTSGGAANAGLKAAQATARATGKTVLSASARQAAKSAAKAKLRQSVARERLKMADDVLDLASEALVTSKEEGEFDFEALDPTGVVAVVNAFNKPICGTTTPTTSNLAPGAEDSTTDAEQSCYNMVQGRVPWQLGGSAEWVPENAQRLCAGTTNPQATIECFNRGIAAHNDWSRGVNECAGTAFRAPDPGTQQTSVVPAGDGFLRFRSNWYTDSHIHIEHNAEPEVGHIQPSWWSAQWKIVPAEGDFVWIQSRWYPDRYFHIETGKLEVGPIEPNWWSAQWKLVPAFDGWVRIQSRWYPDRYIHMETGRLEVGPIQPNWASAVWKPE